MGVTEYGIKTGPSGSNSLYFACSEDDTSLYVSIRGRDPKPRSVVTFTIAGESFRLNTDIHGVLKTDSHVDADNFTALWSAMRKGQWMTVEFSKTERVTFTLQGASKVLPKRPCTPNFWR
jgi:hypothetical protein